MPDLESDPERFGVETVDELIINPAPAGAEEFPPIEEDEL